MSSNEEFAEPVPLLTRIARTLIPSASLILVLATTAAIIYAARCAEMSADAPSAAAKRTFWLSLALAGGAELAGIGLAFWATVRLTRKIARPIERMAREAVSITENGTATGLTADESVAELRDLTAAFNRLLDEQRRRLAEIGTLSSNLLHDIRTPLANMRNSAEAALAGDTASEAALAAVCESCDYLLDAVATDSDIATLSSGLGRANAAAVDLCAEARAAAQLYSLAADARGQTLTVDLPDNPLPIMAHGRRIRQLLGNLLDNAVKYTPDGGRITLTLRADGSRAILSVSDTGIGISASDREQVFTRLFRADTSRTSPGFGLGLALVKAIADFYHGSADCTSTPGEGSTFSVTLPCGAVAAPTARPLPAHVPPS